MKEDSKQESLLNNKYKELIDTAKLEYVTYTLWDFHKYSKQIAAKCLQL